MCVCRAHILSVADLTYIYISLEQRSWIWHFFSQKKKESSTFNMKIQTNKSESDIKAMTKCNYCFMTKNDPQVISLRSLSRLVLNRLKFSFSKYLLDQPMFLKRLCPRNFPKSILATFDLSCCQWSPLASYFWASFVPDYKGPQLEPDWSPDLLVRITLHYGNYNCCLDKK